MEAKLLTLVEKDTEAKQTLEAMFPTMTDAQEPADLAVQIVMSPEVQALMNQIEWEAEPPMAPRSEETLALISEAKDLTLREFLEGLP